MRVCVWVCVSRQASEKGVAKRTQPIQNINSSMEGMPERERGPYAGKKQRCTKAEKMVNKEREGKGEDLFRQSCVKPRTALTSSLSSSLLPPCSRSILSSVYQSYIPSFVTPASSADPVILKFTTHQLFIPSLTHLTELPKYFIQVTFLESCHGLLDVEPV